MEENKGYPVFQYSRFDGKQGQYVVRENNKETFVELVKFINEEIDGEMKPAETGAPMQKITVSADEYDKGHICPTHRVTMVEKQSKTTGKPYLSHSEGSGDDFKICFGKGWKQK